MIWFCIILIILLPFTDEFLKFIFQKKSGNFSLILLSLVPLVIVSNLLVPLKILSFQVFSIILYLSIALFIIGCLIFFIKKIKLVDFSEIQLSSHNVTKSLSFAFVTSILLAITTVLAYFSINMYADTVFYIQISGNFTDSIYSSENTLNLDPDRNIYNELIPSINIFYVFTPLFWCTSVFFPNNITLAYGLILPLIMMSISLNIIRSVVCQIFRSDNVFLHLIFCTLTFFCLQWYLNISNNGSWILGLLLIDTIFRHSKKNDFLVYFSLLGYAFFSSSGILLLVFISFSLLIIFIIFKANSVNILYTVLLFLYSFLICLFCSLPYFQKPWVQVLHTLLQPTVIIAVVTSFFIWNKFFKNKISFNINRTFEKNGFIFFCITSIYVTIIITFFLIMFNGVPYNLYVEKEWIYLYLVISLYLATLFTLTYKKSSIDFKKLIYIVFILNICTILFLIFSWFFNMDALNRVYALLIGYAPISQLPITLFTAFYISLFATSFFAKEISIFITHRNFLKKRNHGLRNNSKKDILVKKSRESALKTYMITAMVTTCIMTNFSVLFNMDFLYLQIKSYKYNNSPVYYLSEKDLKFLENMNFDNYKYSYISDSFFDQIITQGVNLTSYLNFIPGHNYFLRSQIWYVYGFFETMRIWNEKYKYQPIQGNTNEISTINSVIATTVNYVPLINIKNVYGEIIREINYFILKNDTAYFDSISNFLYTIDYNVEYIGNNISIYKLK